MKSTLDGGLKDMKPLREKRRRIYISFTEVYYMYLMNVKQSGALMQGIQVTMTPTTMNSSASRLETRTKEFNGCASKQSEILLMK